MVAPLAVAQTPPRPAAKPGDPQEETAETVDGVKLNCRFYKAIREGNNSVVILLPDYNADPVKNDKEWDGLARELAADAGVNVMRFDYRGHGKSKEVVADRFWNHEWNQRYVTGYNRKPIKNDIDVKDFKSDYFPMLVNDLAAVRTILDQKNDDRQVNTRTIYLVATGSAAPLVQLFLATEWNRAQVKPPPVGLGGNVPDLVSVGGRRPSGTDVAGKDYAGVVLLSPSRTYNFPRGNTIASNAVSNQQLKDWVTKYSRDNTSGDLRNNTSYVVMAGDKDDLGMKNATYFFHDLLNADAKMGARVEAMKNTKLIPIRGAKEKGVELLGKNSQYKTEDTIKAFIEKVESDRKRLNPIDRKYDKPFRINLTSFGVN